MKNPAFINRKKNMSSLISALAGSSFTDGIAKIVSLFKVDPNLAAQHAADLAKIQTDYETAVLNAASQQAIAQAATNTAEAGSKNFFVAGWRPWIGWVCGAGLATQFIIGPFATWIASLAKHPIQFPSLDMGTLLTLLLGMLGLGGMRTYEKVQGVPDSHPLK